MKMLWLKFVFIGKTSLSILIFKYDVFESIFLFKNNSFSLASFRFRSRIIFELLLNEVKCNPLSRFEFLFLYSET